MFVCVCVCVGGGGVGGGEEVFCVHGSISAPPPPGASSYFHGQKQLDALGLSVIHRAWGGYVSVCLCVCMSLCVGGRRGGGICLCIYVCACGQVVCAVW